MEKVQKNSVNSVNFTGSVRNIRKVVHDEIQIPIRPTSLSCDYSVKCKEKLILTPQYVISTMISYATIFSDTDFHSLYPVFNFSFRVELLHVLKLFQCFGVQASLNLQGDCI
jgi:hypothetical protein